jgi:predicted ATPase
MHWEPIPMKRIVLSERIRTKTGGNPFFIKEFLKTLHREGAVFFNRETCRWQWEIEAIQKMATNDNVVDLMIQKIHYLPSRVMQMLMLAACIGSRFDFRTLSLISHADFSDTVNLLWQAVEEELVAPVDDNYKYLFCLNDCQMPPVWFRFVHDKVQEAAYKMFSSKEKQQAHLQIGLLMLANTPKNRLDDKLFDIVNHFNIAKNKIHDPEEKIMIVRLNLKAGNKAMRSAANDTARACFSSALELLPENSWYHHYELTHAIHMGCAQCEYLCGMASLSESRFRFILEKVTSVQEKIRFIMSSSDFCKTRGNTNRP